MTNSRSECRRFHHLLPSVHCWLSLQFRPLYSHHTYQVISNLTQLTALSANIACQAKWKDFYKELEFAGAWIYTYRQEIATYRKEQLGVQARENIYMFVSHRMHLSNTLPNDLLLLARRQNWLSMQKKKKKNQPCTTGCRPVHGPLFDEYYTTNYLKDYSSSFAYFSPIHLLCIHVICYVIAL